MNGCIFDWGRMDGGRERPERELDRWDAMWADHSWNEVARRGRSAYES